MSESVARMRFECPCGAVVEADDGEPITRAVQAHVREVHDRWIDPARIVAMVRPV